MERLLSRWHSGGGVISYRYVGYLAEISRPIFRLGAGSARLQRVAPLPYADARTSLRACGGRNCPPPIFREDRKVERILLYLRECMTRDRPAQTYGYVFMMLMARKLG